MSTIKIVTVIAALMLLAAGLARCLGTEAEAMKRCQEWQSYETCAANILAD